MRHELVHRGLWLAATASLLLALSWLDEHRGGPASALSLCNLRLSRSDAPPADVLIVGSSRAGTALDPMAMQSMLARSRPAEGTTLGVERLAIGRNPLRPAHALLSNYLETRGSPRVLALEVMFQTKRSIDRLADEGSDHSPEQTLFRRDINLMSFSQILTMPAVAMPFSTEEGVLDLWHLRLRGLVLRAGALVYQHLRQAFKDTTPSTCDHDTWTREPSWPADFSFALDDYEVRAPLAQTIETLETTMSTAAAARVPKPWQSEASTGRRYPYDVAEPYRAGEVTLLRSIIELASEHGVRVVLLPLPLYGHEMAPEDEDALNALLPHAARVFDLYDAMEVDLDTFWYDDAHVEVELAGALATATLARHLIESGHLDAPREAASLD